jgi:predicted flap endonuclease-1-like 5' DNA nuclease
VQEPEPEPEQPKQEIRRDNLTDISGIGGSRQEVLYEHGITTYAALVDTSNARLKEILPSVGEDRFNFWKVEAQKKMKG